MNHWACDFYAGNVTRRRRLNRGRAATSGVDHVIYTADGDRNITTVANQLDVKAVGAGVYDPTPPGVQANLVH